MRKFISIFLVLIMACITIATLCGCTSNRSLKEYWFSSYQTQFVDFDANANNGSGNLDEAGSYWQMTVRNDGKIKIMIDADSLDDKKATLAFYINDTLRPNDGAIGIYEFVYADLNLVAGDVLLFHSMWKDVDSATANESLGIDVFIIGNGQVNIVITNL